MPCPDRESGAGASPARDSGPGPASHGLRTAAAALGLLALLAGVARAQEESAPSPDEDAGVVEDADEEPGAEAEQPAAPAGAASEGATAGTGPAPAPDPDAFDLLAAVEDAIGRAHGSVSAQYRLRSGDDDTDQDLYNWFDLRLGDESLDRLSATVFARSSWDLDRQREDRRDYAFVSTQDKYDSSFNTRLYSAYLTYRPKNGPLAVGRIGRQFVYAAETFHVDGVWAESSVLDDDTRLTASVYGGVPVHLYESSPESDWIAGASLSAEPFLGTRATVDYVHVADEYVGTVRDDFAALRIWQKVTPWLSAYARGSYLHGLRDVEGRLTASFDDEDLLVQLSWFSLLEDKDEEFTTEFDPYFHVLHTLSEYDQAKLRAVKGFGEDILVEVGADIRDAADEGTFNRDVQRYYLMPTFHGVPWDGWDLTLIGERWSGDGQRIETMGGELAHVVNDELEIAFGSDYTMYGYDGFRDRERNHVRSVFYELRWELTETLDLRLRHSHEEDDEETYDVFTMGLTLAF